MKKFTIIIIALLNATLLIANGKTLNSVNANKKDYYLRTGMSFVSSTWEGSGNRYDINLGINMFEIGVNYTRITGADDGLARERIVTIGMVTLIPSYHEQKSGCANPTEYNQLCATAIKKYAIGSWLRLKLSAGLGHGWGISRYAVNEQSKKYSEGIPLLVYREVTKCTCDIMEKEISAFVLPLEISMEFYLAKWFGVEIGYSYSFNSFKNDEHFRLAVSLLMF